MVQGIGASGVSGYASWTIDTASAQKPEDKMFKKIDVNGDGKVDETELQAFADEIEKKTGKKLDVVKLFEDYDADNDGVLSQDDLRKGIEAQLGRPDGPPPMPPQGGGEDLFKKIDANGDGKVDASELQTLADEAESKIGKKLDIEQLLKEYDSDSDGALTEAELKAGLEAQWGKPPEPPQDAASQAGNSGLNFQGLFSAAKTINLIDLQM